ncbi:MAG: response regulator transcription factor [Eubacteriaceae bacterium]
MYKILMIEDEKIIAEAMEAHLSKWGYQTKILENFDQILEEFLQFNPQLILMDISLPFYNGYHWCSEIRKISKVPIIFVSSSSDNMNIVMAMTMGGDDFIAKPFDLTVLVAKIQALLRRTYAFHGETNVLEHRGAFLNINEGTLNYQSQKIELTKNDFRILLLLLENKGKIVTREELMKKLWESEYFIDDNTLTVNMTRLRKKMDALGLKDFILTKKGVGYLIGD